jgi:nitrogen fixation NifU-like protein
MAYSEKVLDHYENPRNVGVLEDDQSVGIIQDAKFKTYGCGSAIASSSLVTEWVKGKSLDEAAEIKNTQIAQELALPPVKIHCSVLAEDAIAAAIDNYREKNQ